MMSHLRRREQNETISLLAACIAYANFKIAAKNHKHSVNNPYSQFQKGFTFEQIVKSPKITGVLTKLQCCPTSDGAGCAILCNE